MTSDRANETLAYRTGFAHALKTSTPIVAAWESDQYRYLYTRGWEAAKSLASATEPYTCRDRECREKEAQGKRCPWCWGGFEREEKKA